MKKSLLVFTYLLVLAATCGASGVRAQALNAREVLEKAIEALGGKENWARIQTRTASGRVNAKGVDGTYQLWAKAPDKLKVKLDLPIQHLERGFDGQEGWEKRTSVRELPGSELERLRQRALFNPLFSYLNNGTPFELKGKKQLLGAEAYEIQFSPQGEQPVIFYFDVNSFLPLREDHRVEDGFLKISYGDYHKVGDVLVAFSVKEETPGQTFSITFDDYKLNQPLEDGLFKNPLGEHRNEPYEVSLMSIPLRVYKENDGVETSGETESFVFNLLVKEKYGRALEPKAATIEFYSGANHVKTVELEAAALKAVRKVTYQALAGQEEVFDLQHYFSEPVALRVDRLVYHLELAARGGQTVRQTLEIPVMDFVQKTKLIFPLKGAFVVAAGHDFNEAHKSEWSQQYAYDILALGPRYEIVKTNGETNEDFFAWGREIIAPAGGTVVYARNDVQDNPHPGVILVNDFLKLPDPVWAVAGNVVVIDHGDGEFSLLAHMQKGSVRVKVGDKVQQGDVLGLLGNSGNSDGPHLHYQLMAGGIIYRNDGLPSHFENLESSVPKRGVYLEAK